MSVSRSQFVIVKISQQIFVISKMHFELGFYIIKGDNPCA